MQDIDFDELDRAVSSVLGSTTTAEPKQTNDVPITVSPEPRQSLPVAPAARRVSSGRFMDVVHPSSDMKNASSAPAARPIEIPSAPSKVEDVPTAVEIVDIVKPEARPISPSPAAFSWPETPVAPIEPEQKSSDTDSVVEDADVLESPFLSNTKVEKRPLGAFSADEPQSTPFLDLTDALKDEADAQIAAQNSVESDDSETVTPLKVEDFDLEASEEKLLGIEAKDEVENTEPSKPLQLLEQPDARPLLERDTPAVSNQQAKTPELVQVSTPTVPLGVASIPQQYTEQPASDDQPSGAIYDTESYHQPLTHPNKKNTGWLVVVWILGLILFGAGIGAALYFFVLPML
jgi:hypothetical protein